jgi:hypothetical protein
MFSTSQSRRRRSHVTPAASPHPRISLWLNRSASFPLSYHHSLFVPICSNTRASPARDKAAQPAAAYRVIHDLVVLVHGVLCHRGRQHAGPRPSRCVGRTVRRTLPASLAPLLPSFRHGSGHAVNLSGTLPACPYLSTAASSSTLALRTFNPSSSSHALSAYPASDTPTPGPIPLRAAEVDSDGRRVQIQGVRADDDVARVGEHPLASRSTPLLTFSPPSF